MSHGTVEDTARSAEQAILRFAAGRRGPHVVAQAVCGRAGTDAGGEDLLLLEVTDEPWRAIREEELTDRLAPVHAARVFLMSLSRTTFDELRRAGDPRLLAATQSARVLLDRGGWLRKQLRGAPRRRASARR